MAKEMGYYKDAGLNVTIREFKKPSDIKKVISGDIEFGISDFKLIKERLKGKKVVAIMPIFEVSPAALMSINPAIKSIKDMEGKTLCMGFKPSKYSSIGMILSQGGLDLTDIKIKKIDFDKNNILNQKCDIYSVYSTDQPYWAKKQNITYKLFKLSKNMNLDLYGDMLFTSEKFRFEDPKSIEKFKKASIKGWEYALSHRGKTIDVILNKYNTQNLTKEKLQFEAQEIKKLVSNFKFNREKVKKIKTLTMLLTKSKYDFDLVEFIFSPYIIYKEEVNFIKNHTIKTIDTGDWPPYVINDDSGLRGIGVDIFKIIKNCLYLKSSTKIVEDWSRVLDTIKHKEADLTFSTTWSENKAKYAIFSEPYRTDKIAIATKSDISFIPNLDFLNNKTVAIAKNYTAYELVKTNYPKIKIKSVKNTQEAIKLVNEGEVFAAIDILPTLAYEISNLALLDVKINGLTKFDFKVSFMFRDDYKMLKEMFDRVINDLDEDKKKKILNNYIKVKVQEGYSKKFLNSIYIKSSIIITSLVIVILVIFVQLIKILKLKKELQKIAYRDTLTEIYNRLKLKDELKKLIKLSQRHSLPLSLIYFDIDNFKKVNDNYGHDKGDYVLKTLSKVTMKNLRDTDIFGRWGGEEFIIILPHTNKKEAKNVAQKIRQKIESYNFDGLHITISLGVSTLRLNETIDEFINRADKRLLKAKSSGKNIVIDE